MFSTSYRRFWRFRFRVANLSQEAVRLMDFEIILCDEEVYTSIFASLGNTRLSGLKRISDCQLERKRQKANQWVQRPAFACAKSFSLYHKQKSLLTLQRRKQCESGSWKRGRSNSQKCFPSLRLLSFGHSLDYDKRKQQQLITSLILYF